MYKNPYAGNPYALAMKKGSSKDEEDELLRNIQNYQTRLAVSGQTVPEPKGEDRSALGKAFMGALNFIDRPANAVRGAIQYGFDKNPNTTVGQGMLEGVTKRTEFTGDAMWDKMGIDSKLGRTWIPSSNRPPFLHDFRSRRACEGAGYWKEGYHECRCRRSGTQSNGGQPYQ